MEVYHDTSHTADWDWCISERRGATGATGVAMMVFFSHGWERAELAWRGPGGTWLRAEMGNASCARSGWFGAWAPVGDRIEKHISETLNAALTTANRERGEAVKFKCGQPRPEPRNEKRKRAMVRQNQDGGAEGQGGASASAAAGGKAGGKAPGRGGRGGKGGKSGRGKGGKGKGKNGGRSLNMRWGGLGAASSPLDYECSTILVMAPLLIALTGTTTILMFPVHLLIWGVVVVSVLRFDTSVRVIESKGRG